ncbi:MAG TPA: ABC transporter substrate-binding protein [Casimicrobiaceae bacterium]|nr:ABC transporter substrate-binding protein [Casimicrobiaceae bacterium]
MGGRRSFSRAALLALLVASASAHAADPSKRWHGILAEDVPGFDPAGPTNASAAVVLELIFDRLLTYDYLARPAKLVPMAAEAMPLVTDEGRTWTVKLRKGIVFAADPAFKGKRRELTAEDVVYSFKRFMDPVQRSPYQFMMRNKFVGLDDLARAAKGGKLDYDARIPGIEALDRYTVRFRLAAPDYRFGYLLAHSATGIVAREVVEAYGGDIGRHPVGSGAYVLTSWTPGTRAVLDANPGYRGFVWDFAPGSDPRDKEIVAQMHGKRMPQIGHIELSIIEEDTTYWLTFLRGDLDTVNLLPRFQGTALVGDKLAPDLAAKGISIYRAATPVVGFTAFNFLDPVVGGFAPEKIALRRAIALAYRTDDLVHVVFHDAAEHAEMPIPPGVTGYDPAYRSNNAYDPELANRLLDRFGYKRGADGFRTLPDGKPLELVRNSYTGGSARDEELIWQKSLERIGVRIRSEVLTGAETAKRSTTCTTMLFSWNWFADYPDGENFMQLLYGPNSHESNPGCYGSEAYDKLYRQAEALPDGPERNRLFLAMTRQSEADTAWVLGVYQRRIVVLQPWVLGHKTHPFLYSVLPYVDVNPR